ncbi:MAG: TcpQ domain-containing protein [Rickettsiales bacterium]|jgi:hypothetical protein|nr:TcpQ domain-containing protein [Rickettsiales bacterium]
MVFRRIFAGLFGALVFAPAFASDGSFATMAAPGSMTPPRPAPQYAEPRPIQEDAGYAAWQQNEAEDFYQNESADMPPPQRQFSQSQPQTMTGASQPQQHQQFAGSQQQGMPWADQAQPSQQQGMPNAGQPQAAQAVPVWPLAGSDADVLIAPDSATASMRGAQNIQIVSKIGGDGMKIENNINLTGDAFSGGADMTHSYSAPAGFNPYDGQSGMPFMHAEMPEDDGASVLAISKSDRRARPEARRYETFVQKNADQKDIEVDLAEDVPADAPDAVRSWVVASGQNLREVLQTWCDKEGWDLVWNTPREYPIAASAVFKGRFLDVSSALVRNFSRAAPIPYAKFYKGNRVLVVSTAEEE